LNFKIMSHKKLIKLGTLLVFSLTSASTTIAMPYSEKSAYCSDFFNINLSNYTNTKDYNWCMKNIKKHMNGEREKIYVSPEDKKKYEKLRKEMKEEALMQERLREEKREEERERWRLQREAKRREEEQKKLAEQQRILDNQKEIEEYDELFPDF